MRRPRPRKRERRGGYCCPRFEESVRERKFLHTAMRDETEWFMPEWLHIYFCPFCGRLIKGRGFGTYDKDNKPP